MSRPEYGSDLHLWPVKPEVSPLREEAVARSTDPGTSWEAARSITPEKLRESQRIVLDFFRAWGPSTDEYLCYRLEDEMSPSGARTRRSELVAMGLVRDSGRKDVLRSGRKAIVWESVP